MSDIFRQQDVQALLRDKKVVIIGDSNMRALYKDIVCLLTKNELLPPVALKTKMESSFLNDRLLSSGKLHNGRDYKEEREFFDRGRLVEFFFVTQCYNKYVEDVILKDFIEKQPDIVIMNSCLWDVTRWGPSGVDKYKENLKTLMQRLKAILAPNCLFIWTTTMPISQDLKGGFLIAQVEFLRHQLRFEIMEANTYAWNIVSKSGYDVLDLHYYMQMNISRRTKDGIHWINATVRHVTNTVLTHIALALDFSLPGRIKNKQLEDMKGSPLIPDFPEDEKETHETTSNQPEKRKKFLRPIRRMTDRV